MKAVLALIMSIACSSADAGDRVVVVGQLLTNEPMAYVEDDCPEDVICMRSWWRSVIKVEATVQGTSPGRRVAAAVLQHTGLNDRYRKSVRLFVLRPIDDPLERARLRVDYYLDGMAEATAVFCGPHRPEELGLTVERLSVSGAGADARYCFELPKADEPT